MSFVATLDLPDAADVPYGAAALADALRSQDRNDALLVAGIGEFDATGEWDIAGYASVAAWLRERGMHRRDAWLWVRLARKLRRLPAVLAAWLEGHLSGGQARIIAEVVIDRHEQLFTEHADELLPSLAALSVEDTEIAMRLWRERADAIDDGDEPADKCSEAHLSQTLDGRGVLNATFDAEGYVTAEAALRVADSGDFDVAAPERRGEALVRIFQHWLQTQTSRDPRRHKPQVLVMVQAETIGTDYLSGFVPATGSTLSKATMDRLLCDCDLHRVVMADGVPLDYGRTVKTPPPDLFAAVAARDQHCRFKGCTVPANRCDAHHTDFWARDRGVTALRKLVLQCDHHHDVLHRPGWKAVLHPNGDFEVTDPNGRSWVTEPPGRVQDRLPLPGADEAAGESPLEKHRRRFEDSFLALQRVQRLGDEARARPRALAIAALVALPPRRDWWNVKNGYAEPVVQWRDSPPVPR
ncbi:MAG TPA: DUF222 domain-containing protein [Acidimicrobiales bacterium]|nr:DUF222 domain-containing protein [Acidimicrobiales bacterium]